MTPIITDLTKSEQNKKIELISCLQANHIEKVGSNCFFVANYSNVFQSAKQITRLAANMEEYSNLDLIMIDNIVFLGYWNDGII